MERMSQSPAAMIAEARDLVAEGRATLEAVSGGAELANEESPDLICAAFFLDAALQSLDLLYRGELAETS